MLLLHCRQTLITRRVGRGFHPLGFISIIAVVMGGGLIEINIPAPGGAVGKMMVPNIATNTFTTFNIFNTFTTFPYIWGIGGVVAASVLNMVNMVNMVNIVNIVMIRPRIITFPGG